MPKRGKEGTGPPVTQAQDGALPQRSQKEKYKEAAQRLLFGNKSSKEPSSPASDLSEEEGGQLELDNTIPLEDGTGSPTDWTAVSTVSHTCQDTQTPSMPVDNTEPTLRDILSAVTVCNKSISHLTDEVKGVKAEISYVRQDMQKLRERTAAIESRVSVMEDDLVPMQRDLKYNCHVVDQHAARLDDLENRMRRNNVRALGFPERIEGKDPVTFIEQWLLNTFGKDAFSPLFAVERAHRVPSRPLPPGNHPRAFLFKLLNYKDRDAILAKARTMGGKLAIENSKISLFPDFSAELQKQRAKFMDVKRRLRDLNLPYAMLYPARLRVVALGETRFFDRPDMAAQWLDREDRALKAARPQRDVPP